MPHGDELAHLKLRYKQPEDSRSRLIEQVVRRADIAPSLEKASQNFRFAAAVAAFGQLLRNDGKIEDFTFADAIVLARAARGEDPWGYRSEFLRLAGLADSLAK